MMVIENGCKKSDGDPNEWKGGRLYIFYREDSNIYYNHEKNIKPEL